MAGGPGARPAPACWARRRRPGQTGKVTDRDLLRDAVAELYGVAPHEFVARRAALAAQARGAGDLPAAKQIAALRKPTQSAWIVNQLARSVPAAGTQLAELGADLRKAQRTLDGTAIRELSVRRRELIDDLTRQAFAAVGQPVPPAALRDEVTTTLAAVVADPEVAGQFEAGAMARAARSDGFGATGPLLTVVGPSEAAPARPLKPAPAGPASGKAAPGKAAPGKAAPGRAASSQAAPAKPASPGKAASGKAASGKATTAKATQAKAAPARGTRPVSAAAEEKERRDRRRRAIADAEKAATKADRAAEAATKAEQDLERTVLTLEEKLADAREQLSEARLRARRARTNSRQLRQSLDRMRA